MNQFNFNNRAEFEYPQCAKCKHLALNECLDELQSNASERLRSNDTDRDFYEFREDLIQDALILGLEKIRTRELDFLSKINCLCDLTSDATLAAYCRWCRSVIRRQQALYFRKRFGFNKLVNRIGKTVSDFEHPVEIYPSDEAIVQGLVMGQMRKYLTPLEWAVVDRLRHDSVREIAACVGRSEATIRRIRGKAMELFQDVVEKFL